VTPWLLLLLAYLVGAIPTSYWVGRGLYGVDLRREGSGNLGATNTLRVLGWKAALPVVIFDIFKGFAPVWFFPALLAPGDAARLSGALEGSGLLAFTLGCGAAAIAGHVFSVFVRFRGGKGVATSAGVFLGLAPVAVGIALLLFIGLVAGTRIVSLGSIAAALSLPPLIWFTPHTGGRILFAFSLVLCAFILWAHRSNIGRLIRGEENRFGGRA
jgi:glycerol-3-phosphate acyltransferase PlsY